MMGLKHGAFCLGCCWAVMLLLFVAGVMNPIWIVALTAVVAVEKLAPYAAWTSALMGAGFLAASLAFFLKGLGGNQEPRSSLLWRDGWFLRSPIHEFEIGIEPNFNSDPRWMFQH